MASFAEMPSTSLSIICGWPILTFGVPGALDLLRTQLHKDGLTHNQAVNRNAGNALSLAYRYHRSPACFNCAPRITGFSGKPERFFPEAIGYPIRKTP